jgi:hypothetical protein
MNNIIYLEKIFRNNPNFSGYLKIPYLDYLQIYIYIIGKK